MAFVCALAGFAGFFRVFFHQAFAGSELMAPSDALDFGVAAYLSPVRLWAEGMYSGYPAAADPQIGRAHV
mgnify:FL=1